MRYLLLLSAILGVACQAPIEETNTFKSTKLSVAVEDTDSTLQLTTSGKFVSKADLYCQGELKANLDFTEETQEVDLFSEIEECELRLVEFTIDGQSYTLNELYNEGIYEFDNRDAENRLQDRKLVRSNQVVGEGHYLNCKSDCEFKRVSVKFPYSTLNMEEVVLENNVVYNQQKVGIEEEAAPACDNLTAEFVESEDLFSPPSLRITLENCSNTIDTGDLEFGIGQADLATDGSAGAPLFIDDAHDLIQDFPVVPEKDGYNYTITLDFSQIKGLWSSEVSTVEALTTDFMVAIRNKDGISALVYLIDNKCKVDGKE